MSNHGFTIYESPIGPLTLTGDGAALTGLWFPGRGPADAEAERRPDEFVAVIDQLQAYFSGALREFDLPCEPSGTAFQHRVWAELEHLGYGTTTTYGAIAQRLTAERGEWVSPRAVGAANGANPISIIVACHRVIGSDGSLTGYGGGLQRKRALLDLETRDAGMKPVNRPGRPRLPEDADPPLHPGVDQTEVVQHRSRSGGHLDRRRPAIHSTESPGWSKPGLLASSRALRSAT